MVRVAVLQLTSMPDKAANIETLDRMIREAAGQGAHLVATPENSDLLGLPMSEKIAASPAFCDHPLIKLCKKLSKELGVWIALGSVAVREPEENKIRNRSCLISPQGEVIAQYDKIHLFDVDLPTGESMRESDMVIAGDKIVIPKTDFANLGLTICYDLRFPHLYRELAKSGADILMVPAAFTVPTGEMHWEVLLRARAVENGAFVIAAAQCGDHGNNRKTYGHAMIVDPWGKILAEAGTNPQIIYADLDMDEVTRARAAIGALNHDRFFEKGM